ncbi:type I phosphomannose isomerase catalytic subunit [Paramaledivibacter caminithermalis]|jgi:mannose-6-phosphate isomerase|uniref:Phosphohexomutase n=1 Tax=Paramaledivibacter caminithermalis (strain DSM 15212 / CIP 107654 / DViRD3) TaxID=1121301 RepID=A0A1M6MSC9_PARC5|nr:type I phosphomannose isomerase catalytic subunit [Paramaledivibacter caminithermalis]SHJ86183.1 mannose-6-phosphate isomerase, type 1 [Paramaledivibacter caminithermalis DSM 15212]
MYPLKFTNIYFNKIWGGRDIELFRDNLPEGLIGESWDIACHPNGTSIIANGEFRGIRLDELIQLKGKEIMGYKISKEFFPLLIKIINARDRLSVQVHPDDGYAKEKEGEMGKTEIWYVMEAVEGANLILGMKSKCSKEEFKKAVGANTLDEYMNKVPVKKGDIYFVKSGLLHAIGEGVIIVEIQQNSDTTYRVYDYNRGRELHIDKALDVVDLSLKSEKCTGIKVEREEFIKTYVCLNEKFSLEIYDIKESITETSDKERFYIFTCVEGKGDIIYKNGSETIEKGESILIPAVLGEYSIMGNMKILKSYVPDIMKVQQDILNEIRK